MSPRREPAGRADRQARETGGEIDARGIDCGGGSGSNVSDWSAGKAAGPRVIQPDQTSARTVKKSAPARLRVHLEEASATTAARWGMGSMPRRRTSASISSSEAFPVRASVTSSPAMLLTDRCSTAARSLSVFNASFERLTIILVLLMCHYAALCGIVGQAFSLTISEKSFSAGVASKLPRISISLPEEICQLVKVRAAKQGISDSGYASQLLTKALTDLSVAEKQSSYGSQAVAETLDSVLGATPNLLSKPIGAMMPGTGLKVRQRRAVSKKLKAPR